MCRLAIVIVIVHVGVHRTITVQSARDTLATLSLPND